MKCLRAQEILVRRGRREIELGSLASAYGWTAVDMGAKHSEAAVLIAPPSGLAVRLGSGHSWRRNSMSSDSPSTNLVNIPAERSRISRFIFRLRRDICVQLPPSPRQIATFTVFTCLSAIRVLYL